MIGLTPAAWAIVLVALGTYLGLASAYFLARPALRGAVLQANLLLLQDEVDDDPRVEDIRALAVRNLTARLTNRIPEDRRSNRIGSVFLLLSLATFTSAVLLQLGTDPAFSAGRQRCGCQASGPATLPPVAGAQRE